MMFVFVLVCALIFISPCFVCGEGAAFENAAAVDSFPVERLHIDWMYQDYGLKIADCFTANDKNGVEVKMIQKVLAELKEYQVDVKSDEAAFLSLTEKKIPGSDPAWKSLYLKLCAQRRIKRIEELSEYCGQYLFAKHYIMGSRQGMFAMTGDVTDSEVFASRGPNWHVGSSLCLLEVNPNGEVKTKVLLDSKEGIVRDPDLSFDADQIAFAWKKNANDDYHLYMMNWPDGKIEQRTFGKATADVEPCWLPNGNLIFNSTRCDETAPCWWSNVLNLYTCDAQGRYMRRLSWDQDHITAPHLLDDGRIIYTRWDYIDRRPIYLQPLFVMNWDGTSQTEYYGNNSWAPTSIIHARGIPGTQKVIAVASGHHCDQTGKLIVIDRRQGTQEGAGIEYTAPVRPFKSMIKDRFGHDGETFQYPYALDEENYLVSFFPEGGVDGRHQKYTTQFGIYWMNRDGRRELLVYDPAVSSGQIIPLAKRERPVLKSTAVDLEKNEGTFYVQNVYIGPGLEGIAPGTVKKLRVVGLEYRAQGTAHTFNHIDGQVTTPVSISNGSWSVRHVLGTVDVEPDGSALFSVPARTPVYFQLLDENGSLVQTMRSWAIVQPGESFGCVGCHEDKNSSFFGTETQVSMAMKRGPQKLVPFFKPGEEPKPERIKHFNETERRALDYLSVNAPQGTDRPLGFSYLREIQPIWDEHCVDCHHRQKGAEGNAIPLNLLADTGKYTWEDCFADAKWDLDNFPNRAKESKNAVPGRDYAESYLQLTRYGYPNELVNWLPAASDPPMIPPRSFGSSKSGLMKYLRPEHYGVRLTREEIERVACWIDLNVPYCGSYMEANHWDKIKSPYLTRLGNELRGIYLYHEEKRLRHAVIELDHLDKYKEHLQKGTEYRLDQFPKFDFGGPEEEERFIASIHEKVRNAPVFGAAEGFDARGGKNIPGNARRNLALNPDAETFALTSYPFASSNSHYKYLDETSPALAIDGKKAGSDSAWRPNKRTDLWLKIEFGRKVLVDEVEITLKIAEGQKKTWSRAVLQFQGGGQCPIELKNTGEPQRFQFPPKITSAVTLTGLQEDFPLSVNGVTEFEVWGQDLLGGARCTLEISGVNYPLRWSPPGKFFMGSPEEEAGHSSDEQRHEVTLTKGYWILETEVTQAMYESVMGYNPSEFKGGNLPVEQVGRPDAERFCAELTKLAGFGTAFTLPTEAQWEYACRAGTTGAYGGTGKIEEMAWYDENSGDRTHEVGTKTANAWGIFDMNGNVWEWCSDGYADLPSEPAVDPAGPEKSMAQYAVEKGGSWCDFAEDARSASRTRDGAGNRYKVLGFRFVLVP